MNYILMHKEIPVLELSLDEETSSVLKIGEVFNFNHIPLGINYKNNIVDRAALNSWWIDRSIPASRSGIRQALETLNIPNTQTLLVKCFGLSLSDQYWVKPIESDLTWKQVNFFDNPFSEDIGDVLLGKAVDRNNMSMASPDNTSDGFLKKRWKIIDGKRCLLKCGSAPFMQQPFNEVIATKLAERLGIPHIPYTLIWDNGQPYSVCEDFVTPDTELVSAWRVMQSQKKNNSISVYQHYINCCLALGVSDIVTAVDQMIVLDYLIANEDRHQNNFGVIRNAETLEWISAAPIFDSGSSLGYDKLPNRIISQTDIECKPFKKTHQEQLKLVSDLTWIDFSKLDGIGQEIREVFAGVDDFIDEIRIDAIVRSVEHRIENLKTIAQSETKQIDNIQEDVQKNEAQDYTKNS